MSDNFWLALLIGFWVRPFFDVAAKILGDAWDSAKERMVREDGPPVDGRATGRET